MVCFGSVKGGSSWFIHLDSLGTCRSMYIGSRWYQKNQQSVWQYSDLKVGPICEGYNSFKNGTLLVDMKSK